ncbi:MAG: hypothetical protein FWF56_05890 [Firmicutes bacterium]|nr:hypothetical protein [Bacillota bacterium]MCL1953212.1 hypothetical protein [Bacillota bacterium]
MIEFIKKILLFLSAFSPMLLIIAIKITLQVYVFCEIKCDVLNIVIMIVCYSIFVISVIVLFFFRKWLMLKDGESIKIIRANNITAEHFLGQSSLFILLSMSFNLNSVVDLVVLLIVITMIGIIYISNDLYFLNPLFNLCGYKCFDITYKKGSEEHFCKLFSRNSLQKNSCVGSDIVVYISNYSFVIEKQTNNK